MIVAIVGIAVGVVGVALAAVALVKFYRLQRSYDLLAVHEARVRHRRPGPHA